MLAAYDLCFMVRPAGDFFELAYLPGAVMALTALVSIVWAVLTVVLWRADVYRRVERAAARALGRGDATARPGA